MKKRVLAGLLWFFAAWYLWGAIASVTGLAVVAGPFLGVGVALFVAGDPLGRIWGGKSVGGVIAAPAARQSEAA